MIASQELALSISSAGESFIKQLGSILDEAEHSTSPNEYEQLKKAIGSVIGTLEIDMLWPLYKKHPQLEPENLKDWKNES